MKEDDMILPKIKKLQENMRKIKNNTQTVNIPEFVISSQSPKKVNMPVKSTENKVENVKKNFTKHDMGYDIVEDIKKAKTNISLFEMCNLPQQKEKLLKSLETPMKELQNDNQADEEIGEAILLGKSKYRTLAFLLSFEIFNYNVHNCLVDSGASVNVMPFSVCKKINGQPKPTTGQVIQLDRTVVKVIGEMEDVMIRLSADERVCQYIDIVVADISDAYGLVLSWDWVAKLEGYFASNWSHV